MPRFLKTTISGSLAFLAGFAGFFAACKIWSDAFDPVAKQQRPLSQSDVFRLATSSFFTRSPFILSARTLAPSVPLSDDSASVSYCERTSAAERTQRFMTEPIELESEWSFNLEHAKSERSVFAFLCYVNSLLFS